MIPMKNRRFFARLGIGVALAAIIAAPLWMMGYRINETESLPVGIWRIVGAPGIAERGQIVNFCPPNTATLREARDRGYLHDGPCQGGLEPLFKPVVAVAGDIIEITDAGVAVNGQDIESSTPIKIDGRGMAMPRLQRGQYIVKPGQVWVVSSHTPYSFDSRYFGPVDVAAVAGRAIPIWIKDSEK